MLVCAVTLGLWLFRRGCCVPCICVLYAFTTVAVELSPHTCRAFALWQIPEDPYAVWSSGDYNMVPMLLGVNNNEGQTFIYDIDEIPAFLVELLQYLLFTNSQAEAIIDQYKYLAPDPLGDGRPFLSQWLTDFWFRCASEQWAASAYKRSVPAYFYRFDHVFSDAAIFAKFGLPSVCVNLVRWDAVPGP